MAAITKDKLKEIQVSDSDDENNTAPPSQQPQPQSQSAPDPSTAQAAASPQEQSSATAAHPPGRPPPPKRPPQGGSADLSTSQSAPSASPPRKQPPMKRPHTGVPPPAQQQQGATLTPPASPQGHAGEASPTEPSSPLPRGPPKQPPAKRPTGDSLNQSQEAPPVGPPSKRPPSKRQPTPNQQVDTQPISQSSPSSPLLPGSAAAAPTREPKEEQVGRGGVPPTSTPTKREHQKEAGEDGSETPNSMLAVSANTRLQEELQQKLQDRNQRQQQEQQNTSPKDSVAAASGDQEKKPNQDGEAATTTTSNNQEVKSAPNAKVTPQQQPEEISTSPKSSDHTASPSPPSNKQPVVVQENSSSQQKEEPQPTGNSSSTSVAKPPTPTGASTKSMGPRQGSAKKDIASPRPEAVGSSKGGKATPAVVPAANSATSSPVALSPNPGGLTTTTDGDEEGSPEPGQKVLRPPATTKPRVGSSQPAASQQQGNNSKPSVGRADSLEASTHPSRLQPQRKPQQQSPATVGSPQGGPPPSSSSSSYVEPKHHPSPMAAQPQAQPQAQAPPPPPVELHSTAVQCAITSPVKEKPPPPPATIAPPVPQIPKVDRGTSPIRESLLVPIIASTTAAVDGTTSGSSSPSPRPVTASQEADATSSTQQGEATATTSTPPHLKDVRQLLRHSAPITVSSGGVAATQQPTQVAASTKHRNQLYQGPSTHGRGSVAAALAGQTTAIPTAAAAKATKGSSPRPLSAPASARGGAASNAAKGKSTNGNSSSTTTNPAAHRPGSGTGGGKSTTVHASLLSDRRREIQLLDKAARVQRLKSLIEKHTTVQEVRMRSNTPRQMMLMAAQRGASTSALSAQRVYSRNPSLSPPRPFPEDQRRTQELVRKEQVRLSKDVEALRQRNRAREWQYQQSEGLLLAHADWGKLLGGPAKKTTGGGGAGGMVSPQHPAQQSPNYHIGSSPGLGNSSGAVNMDVLSLMRAFRQTTHHR